VFRRGDNDAIEQLAVLRRETDGDIGIGGANLATQVLRAHLLDELLLFTHPIVLGAGPRFSTRSTNPSNSTSWNSVHSTRA
jgi:dihydrofolate reductase